VHCGCADGSEGARLTSACVQAIAAAILRVEHKQGSSVAWATFISRMGNVYQLHGRCSSDAWATFISRMGMFISCMGDVHQTHGRRSSVAWEMFISCMGDVHQTHGRRSSVAWAMFTVTSALSWTENRRQHVKSRLSLQKRGCGQYS